MFQKKNNPMFSSIKVRNSTDLIENFRQYSGWNAASTNVKIICLFIKCSLLAVM